MQTRKTRHQFYLPDHLSARLDALALEPGMSKTTILSDALGAWFEGREAEREEKQFGKALDRQVRAVERMQGQLDYLTEVLGLFVRHQLTLTAHHPALDQETQRLGQLRYERFVRMAGEMATRGARRGNNKSPQPDKEIK